MIEDEQKKQDGGNEEAADKEVLTQPEAAGEDTAGDNAPEPVTPGAGEAGADEEKTEIPPAPSISGLLGVKVGMTTFYTEDGRALGVTAIEVGPCVVTQVKTPGRDGYESVQIGFRPAKSVNKPLGGHLERSGGRFRHLEEFSVGDMTEFEVGQEIRANLFEAGQTVKVSGISKGRGFSGGVRRWGFHGGPKTHGQSDRHRAPGSIGAGSSPGRVWPGTKMAGHYGAAKISQRGLQVVMSDPARNIVLIKGSVPGPRHGLVRIEKQVAG